MKSLTHLICKDPFSKQGLIAGAPVRTWTYICGGRQPTGYSGPGRCGLEGHSSRGPQTCFNVLLLPSGDRGPLGIVFTGPTNDAAGSGPGTDRQQDTLTQTAAEVTLQTAGPLESVWLSIPTPSVLDKDCEGNRAYCRASSLRYQGRLPAGGNLHTETGRRRS